MNKIQEKRKYPRTSCNLNIIIFSSIDEIKGKIANISENGIKFISSQIFKPLHKYTICFWLLPKMQKINCEATAVWSQKIGKNNQTSTGFFFSKINKKEKEKIRKYINLSLIKNNLSKTCEKIFCLLLLFWAQLRQVKPV
ncbi:hypothetical protein CL633_02925 [bacterium]|nr:hypothetical protein [bacterium]|tara:strand:- start:1363 stop:1782 length:420 start_codon:yes stop_codon:yes gene_type:complete